MTNINPPMLWCVCVCAFVVVFLCLYWCVCYGDDIHMQTSSDECKNNANCFNMQYVYGISETMSDFRHTLYDVLRESSYQTQIKEGLESTLREISNNTNSSVVSMSVTLKSDKESKLNLDPPQIVSFVVYGIAGCAVILGLVGQIHAICIGADSIRISGVFIFGTCTMRVCVCVCVYCMTHPTK